MPYYAQLQVSHVVAITETHLELSASNDLVEIDGMRADLLGYSYNAETGQFTPPEPVNSTPVVCSPAQGLIALNVLHGVTEKAVSDAIASIPDPATRYTSQIAFSRATEWRRSSATMQQLAAMLNLTDADLDALFSFAVTVEV